MAGMNTGNMSDLTRAELWSSSLKETLKDELMATKYVDWALEGEFPDGTQFTIPSVGDAQVDDYVEDTEVKVRPLDTGEFTFNITQYKSSGLSITEKARMDSYYSDRLMASFLPKEERALMEAVETHVLSRPEAGITANSNETINGKHHRYAAGGTAGVLDVADFAYANLALTTANVSASNRIAIVDPSVGFTLETLTNLVNVSNNPMWEGIISSGITTGMKFVKNVYGFDVYCSNYLTDVTDSALPQRDGSTTVDFSSTNGKANLFFSAGNSNDERPMVGAFRQMPKVDVVFEPLKQRTSFITTAYYEAKMYRPENMVVIPSKTNVS